MEVTEPTDAAFFFAGRYEGRTDCNHRSTVWPVLKRQALDAHRQAKCQARYQDSEGYYLQGDYGFSR